jgi:flagellar biosynthesis protein FlhF
MDIRTYRAATMHEALSMVRRELGPDAAVLHTRRVRTSRLFGLIQGPRNVEVTASAEVSVPSRLPQRRPLETRRESALPAPSIPATGGSERRRRNQPPVKDGQMQRSRSRVPRDLPQLFQRLFADLIDANFSEESARELIEQIAASIADKSRDLAHSPNCQVDLARTPVVEGNHKVCGKN